VALADRLSPVQDALADLEREYHAQARASNEPTDWEAWDDLHAALMAVRAAQGRDARGERCRPRTVRARLCYRLPVEASSEEDDRRLDHLDLEGMNAAECWAETHRVAHALAALAPTYDPTVMRRGVPCSGRGWLLNRLRLLGARAPAAGA
jgi:hypothetical protein